MQSVRTPRRFRTYGSELARSKQARGAGEAGLRPCAGIGEDGEAAVNLSGQNHTEESGGFWTTPMGPLNRPRLSLRAADLYKQPCDIDSRVMSRCDHPKAFAPLADP